MSVVFAANVTVESGHRRSQEVLLRS